MAKKLGSETIVVRRKPKVDKLDLDTGEATPHDVKNCAILPGQTYDTAQGWITTDGLDVFAPPDADIIPDDTVIARGRTYRVEGVVADFVTRKGKLKARRVKLERVASTRTT